MENTNLKKEAKWLSDKETLDKNCSKFKKDNEGLYFYIDIQSCKMLNVDVENADRWVEEKNNGKEAKEGIDKFNEFRYGLGESYEEIIKILKDYLDIKDIYYPIIGVWIIGTYFFKEFLSYPYLYINATKGSAKSKTVNLVTSLSWNGKVILSPTEAVLFRTAGTGTLGIDEFERISSKESQGIREILNASYKRGSKVSRMRKKKTLEGEKYVIEEFEPYCPILMSNIYGMDEILGDRCITLIFEKTSKQKFLKKAEDFSINEKILAVKEKLNKLSSDFNSNKCSYFQYYTDAFPSVKCSYVVIFGKNIYILWNKFIDYIYNKYNNTYNTLNTLDIKDKDEKINIYSNDIYEETSEKRNINTQVYEYFDENEMDVLKVIELLKTPLGQFFDKLDKSGIVGRDLELFFPLFVTARTIDEFLFEEILKIAKELTKYKKIEEIIENKDILIYQFVSQLQNFQYYNVRELTELFKRFIDYSYEDQNYNWLNPKWFGRALKRLDLIIEKKRVGYGVCVMPNVKKALKKYNELSNLNVNNA